MRGPDSTQAERPARRVTDVIARYQVGHLAVCRDKSQVAVHCQTQNGTVLLLLTEVAFVKGCRGSVDHNLNPFRTLEEIRRGDAAPEGSA